MECRQDVSVVRLHGVVLERFDDVSRGRNNNVLSVRLHNVSNKSQANHPTSSIKNRIKKINWEKMEKFQLYVDGKTSKSRK